jgi:hypothetical protein
MTERSRGMTTDPAHRTAAAAQLLSESNADRMRAMSGLPHGCAGIPVLRARMMPH